MIRAKIRAAILLFILICGTLSLFLIYFPISLNSDLFKKLIISVLPTYIMLYVALLIHLFNYINQKYIVINPGITEQSGWDIYIDIFIDNKSDKVVTLLRIESEWFKTKHLNNSFVINEESYKVKKIKLSIREPIINDSLLLRCLTKKNKLLCIFYIKKDGIDKIAKVKKNVINPFKK